GPGCLLVGYRTVQAAERGASKTERRQGDLGVAQPLHRSWRERGHGQAFADSASRTNSMLTCSLEITISPLESISSQRSVTMPRPLRERRLSMKVTRAWTVSPGNRGLRKRTLS